MLAATSTSVQETQPVVSEVNEMMGKTLPETVDAASASLTSASQAASSLESTIQSLDTFRMVMSGTPFLSAFVPSDAAPYNPDESMADSLNRLAISIENMPKQFEEMAAGMDKADDNLALIQANLDTMSSSVALISSSLGQYRDMISRSESSMTSLQSILTTVQNNSSRIITGATIALALFLFWLLAAQIVIFSQGLELYRGTAGHMEGGPETPVVESAAAA
jgi:uncharacterized phage infection (PIP) family protein YhgE